MEKLIPCGRKLDLQQIRTHTLRPLHYLIRQTSWGGIPEQYDELIPSLKLFLSNNELEDIPGELFKLENLTVLSLRSNNLTEIYSSIGKLAKLQDLSVGSNQLNWLPWELLQLTNASLKRWALSPNPFILPVPSTLECNKSVPMRGSDHAYQVASTHIAFLDIAGVSSRHWRPAPSSMTEHWPDPARIHEFLGPATEERTKVPSLMELALRACYKAPRLSQLPFLLSEDVNVAHLIQLLKQTFYLKEAGGRNCSVCGHEYIVPRTEWVEWWCLVPPNGSGKMENALDQSGGPIPFLRRGCSWACWVQDPETSIRGWNLAPSGDRLRGGDTDQSELRHELYLKYMPLGYHSFAFLPAGSASSGSQWG